MDVDQTSLLLPAPRHVEWLGDDCQLAGRGWIVLNALDSQSIYPLALLLQADLLRAAPPAWEITASPLPAWRGGGGGGVIFLTLLPGGALHPQGYTLSILPDRIDMASPTPAGLFYALQTLRQLLEQHGSTLPGGRIRDWPDFPVRGVLLDISRDRVPTQESLYALVDLLASWKINQLQLYTEHTFAYHLHPEVWAEASPLTGEQILALDAFCRERFIELVPNQTTFGHMTRWLAHGHYRHLAECPDGCDTRWGHFDQPFSLNPADPGSLELVRGLLDELLPHFSSRQFNANCDETVDLGQGRSRELAAQRGVGQVYLDYLLAIYREIKGRGYTLQFWGDIVMEHPELARLLPRDALALEWGYEANHPFDEHGAIFAAAGVPFYVCPGTSSWNSIAGRTDNALGNLRNAAQNGLRNGACGYLITDWGDNGHWQPMPVSYAGFAAGAALSWACDANWTLDLPRLLDLHAFHDPAGVLGRLACDLGNVYQMPGVPLANVSPLFGVMKLPLAELQSTLAAFGPFSELAPRFQRTLERIDALMAPLPQARPARPDAALLAQEFTWCADMLRHACRRASWAGALSSGCDDPAGRAALAAEIQDLFDRHRRLWLARSRPSGLRESAARLEALRNEYLG